MIRDNFNTLDLPEVGFLDRVFGGGDFSQPIQL